MKDLFRGDDKIRKYLAKQAKTPVPEQEKKLLWGRIEQSVLNIAPQRRPLRTFLWTAASVCILIMAAAILFFSTPVGEVQLASTFPDESIVMQKIKKEETVKLITVTGEEIIFDGDEPEIIAGNYSKEEDITENEQPRLNQLIVPTGKKTSLILEDGTKLWVNSDSKVIYPEKFAKDQRLIIVDGEIYADVSHDKTRPFIAKTRDMQVQVLGTEFNLTAYSTDNAQSVILVSGKVEVTPGERTPEILKPNSILTLSDNNVKIKKNIDVYNYICWKDDILVLDGIYLEDLIQRINRHYGNEITIDKELAQRRLSGKLDLKNPVEDLMKTLSVSLNCKYSFSENRYIINSY